MIYLDCKQGSQEWHWRRLGIPTASGFGRILTPKTRKLSASADGYMHELLSEWLIGIPHGVDSRSMGFMDRGHDLEPAAVAYYEMVNDVATTPIGLVLRDDGMVGCSPDRLVGADGGLEVKVPSAAVHVSYMLDGLEDYFAQVQGGLWLTGRSWWDLISYHPELPPVVVRHMRDEEFIAALAPAVEGFVARLKAARERLLRMGVTPATTLHHGFVNALAEHAIKTAPEYAF